MNLSPNIPTDPLTEKWDNCRFSSKLVSPTNRRKYEIIVIVTGLAGASAAATLGEQGYSVKAFCLQDSPRRAHSIVAQGGINAAKNYQNDGDFRSREANVYRLAQVSNAIIDHCVAQGIIVRNLLNGQL